MEQDANPYILHLLNIKCLLLTCFSLQEVVLSPVQDGDIKPQIDSNKANNYNIVKEVSSGLHLLIIYDTLFCSVSLIDVCVRDIQILLRLSKLCYPSKKSRVQQQRLLKNMGAHTVVLDLLQIPYETVSHVEPDDSSR